MNHSQLLERLHQLGNPIDAESVAKYHKVARPYLGVRVPAITQLARDYWSRSNEDGLIPTCEKLWLSNIAEARVLVGKLLEVKAFRNTQAVWDFLNHIKMDLDAWAIADHLEKGAKRCILSDRRRLDEMEEVWLNHPNFWIRRACLVFTLDDAKKGRNPERSLKWAAGMVDDREWFIQKAIGWWLRELSKHNPERVVSFLDDYRLRMKPFAVREAEKYIK